MIRYLPILVVDLFIIILISLYDIIGPELLYYSTVVILFIMYLFRTNAILPYGYNDIIDSKTFYILTAVLIIMIINSLFTSDMILFWYPTNWPFWFIFPMIPFLYLYNGKWK